MLNPETPTTKRLEVEPEDAIKLVSAFHLVSEHYPIQSVVAACLIHAITLQTPDITAEQLVEAVKQSSDWLASYLDTTIPLPNTPNFVEGSLTVN